jgi:hypothetical protein
MLRLVLLSNLSRFKLDSDNSNKWMVHIDKTSIINAFGQVKIGETCQIDKSIKKLK